MRLRCLQRKPDLQIDRLRMISEAFSEQVDSIYVFGGRVDADADTDVRRFLQLQIGNPDIADPLVVKVGTGAIHTPGFQVAELRVGKPPPLWREMAESSAAVAR